jgi:RNA polymerase sigma-70 factor (ECF subfamily)
MERVQAGDQTAYRTLLDEVTGELRAFLARQGRDHAETEDRLQDVLLALHRARHTYDPARRFDSWLYAIARHVGVDAFRRGAVRARRETPTAPDELDRARGAGSGEIALDAALSTLPAAQREAVEMVKLHGLDVAEVAARTGVSEGALRVRIHRAYTALRERLLGKDD